MQIVLLELQKNFCEHKEDSFTQTLNVAEINNKFAIRITLNNTREERKVFRGAHDGKTTGKRLRADRFTQSGYKLKYPVHPLLTKTIPT